MQISNQNFCATKKHPTFGVRKTDSVQSFINEIRTTNPNLGDIERLSIVQKMKKSDTFEQLQKEANENNSMFGNRNRFNIANKQGFTIFINSICIKIMQELKTFGETVGKFIIQVEYEDGKKEEKNIINAFRTRLIAKEHYQKNKVKRSESNKEYYQKNKEKIKESQKEYYQNNPEKRSESQKEYYETHKDKIKEYRQKNKEKIKEYNKEYYLKKKENATLKKQEKEVREFLNDLRNQKY